MGQALNDKNAREIVYEKIRPWQEGEVKLANLAIEHPELLEAMSQGFKQAVRNKGVSVDLAPIVQETQIEEKAQLQVLTGMFNLEIVLVDAATKKWERTIAIPVFYIPVDDANATVVQGVDNSLNPVSLPADTEVPPYPLIAINFDDRHIRTYSS